MRIVVLLAALPMAAATSCSRGGGAGRAPSYERPIRAHFDHGSVVSGPFETPQAVTRACLGCHQETARDVMRTSHWTWLGPEGEVPGHAGTQRIGKRNLLNNFCISIAGNEPPCTKCHAGYGWRDATYDFGRAENVDCLACHERTGTYVKVEAGMPKAGVDLVAAARSVGYPLRENCLSCHAYGGGGMGVKHGDIDTSLLHPSADDDVHMGRYGFLCIDCHTTSRHELRGRAFSVGVEGSGSVGCTDCHSGPPHDDARLNAHLSAIACPTCHVPTYARSEPTKMFWDWSQAGDPDRKENEHEYLKLKGAFVYDGNVMPEYGWFNLRMGRYLFGDRIDPAVTTPINRPLGDLADPEARIWPFKVHRALQPYDTEHDILLPPVTGGTGGYWTTFDWDSALRLGATAAGVPYSGRFGFARTEMFWPLAHMVAPKERSLRCVDCHAPGGRLDFRALGYDGDPLRTGGRP